MGYFYELNQKWIVCEPVDEVQLTQAYKHYTMKGDPAEYPFLFFVCLSDPNILEVTSVLEQLRTLSWQLMFEALQSLLLCVFSLCVSHHFSLKSQLYSSY